MEVLFCSRHLLSAITYLHSLPNPSGCPKNNEVTILRIASFFTLKIILIRYIDNDLGEEIPEKDYGGTCKVYDNDNPSDPWHNVKV